MRSYKTRSEQTKNKEEAQQRLALEAELPLDELIAGAREDIEAFADELGLTLIERVMELEVQQKLGRWGEQKNHRHGHQRGYVIFGGSKVRLERPRLRSQDDKEVALSSYRAFQKDGKMQAAVARQLMRQCSTRDYEGAIEGCCKVMALNAPVSAGIGRRPRSRNWNN